MARSEAIIRPVLVGDALELARTIRAADAAEVLAATGQAPLEAIRESLTISAISFTGELAGHVAVVGGVVTVPADAFLDEPFAVVWMLSGSAVELHRGAFLRASRRVLATLLESFPVLGNMVDARYVAALRWARALGAEVQPARPWGVSGMPFHPVIWRA